MEQKPQYKRRIIVVNKAFQFKFALVMASLFALAAFLVWWEIYQSISGLFTQGLIQDPELMLTIQKINQVVMIKMIIAQALVVVLSLLISHYVAGPIYRLDKSLQELQAGDLTHRIHLRRFDQLTAVANTFNTTVAALQEMVKNDRHKLDEVIQKLEKSGGAAAEAATDLKEVGKGFRI